MMQSIKGIFKDGLVHPSEPVSYPEYHPVIITFLDVPTSSKTVGLSFQLSVISYQLSVPPAEPGGLKIGKILFSIPLKEEA